MESNPELGIPNVEFIVMPSKLGQTNLGADCKSVLGLNVAMSTPDFSRWRDHARQVARTQL